jgi:hypothetical protein
MTEQLDPFRDPLIAVDNGGPLDAVEAWEWAWRSHDISRPLMAAGERLAREVERNRDAVAALEAETVELRGLVERAQRFLAFVGDEWGNPDDIDAWTADADRVLAADTGDA